MDSSEGREANLKIHQYTNVHAKGSQSLKLTQLLTGNTLYIDTIEEVEKLITLLDFVYIYNIWIALAAVVMQVKEYIINIVNHLQNVLYIQGSE